MVNNDTNALNRIFSALSDPTRRAIISRLVNTELTVSELAEPFAMSLPAISKHLRVLEQAGLIRRRVDGRTHYLSLNPKSLHFASNWFETYHAFWEESLDALADLVEAKEDS